MRQYAWYSDRRLGHQWPSTQRRASPPFRSSDGIAFELETLDGRSVDRPCYATTAARSSAHHGPAPPDDAVPPGAVPPGSHCATGSTEGATDQSCSPTGPSSADGTTGSSSAEGTIGSSSAEGTTGFSSADGTIGSVSFAAFGSMMSGLTIPYSPFESAAPGQQDTESAILCPGVPVWWRH